MAENINRKLTRHANSHICIINEQYAKKLFAKININEHILPIFLIYFINILAKTIKYKESNSFYSNFSKPYVRFAEIWELSFSLQY